MAAAWGHLGAAVRNGMDRRRFELATIAAARELGSTYCTVAHGTFLRDVCHDEDTLMAIAQQPDGDGLDEPDRSVFQFATKVVRDASSIEQGDVDRLRDAGLSDTAVADVV